MLFLVLLGLIMFLVLEIAVRLSMSRSPVRGARSGLKKTGGTISIGTSEVRVIVIDKLIVPDRLEQGKAQVLNKVNIARVHAGIRPSPNIAFTCGQYTFRLTDSVVFRFSNTKREEVRTWMN